MRDARPGDDLLANPIEWGRQLILTNDHDPLYVGLTQWGVRGARLRRFMVAYWCCYSVGASWYISQHSGSRFWDTLETAAANVEPSPLGGRWPRAHERRHWRGQKCVDSVLWLSKEFPNPDDAVKELEDLPRPLNLRGVELAVTRWPQFGPWIAFKAADMLERVMHVPVEFPTSITTLYKDPRKGAEMMAPLLGLETPQQVTDHLLDAYKDMAAPPHGSRFVNVQEVETVLCKFKSARNGHYYIGQDTRDHRAQLSLWAAEDLLKAYPT